MPRTSLEIFAQIDAQNRGAITLPEFLKALQTYPSLCRELQFKYPLHQRSLDQVTLAFKEMEIDAVGYVDKRRFYAWFHSTIIQHKDTDTIIEIDINRRLNSVAATCASLNNEKDSTLKNNEEQQVEFVPVGQIDEIDVAAAIDRHQEESHNTHCGKDPEISIEEVSSCFLTNKSRLEENGLDIIIPTNNEIDRYYKLGEILAMTESLASNESSKTKLNLGTNQIMSNPPHIGIQNEESEENWGEYDPLATYYYLGNVYAGVTKQSTHSHNQS